MGKNQHSKDKLYINPQEYAENWGGYMEKMLPFKKLPIQCCGFSLQKFTSPVCTNTGEVYDAENLIPFLIEHSKNPITGMTLSIKHLTPMKIRQNETGSFVDPVTEKVLHENAHVVCNLKSGVVYLYDTVLQMNKKANNYEDLVSGEKFDWATHIVSIQDPTKPEKRDVTQFWHVKNARELGLVDAEGNMLTTLATSKQKLSKIGLSKDILKVGTGPSSSSSSSSSSAAAGAGQQLALAAGGAGQEDADSVDTFLEKHSEFINLNPSLRGALVAQKKRMGELAEDRKAKQAKVDAENAKLAERQKSRTTHKLFTTGTAARGFTSTRMTAQMQNEYRTNTDAEERQLLYDRMRQRGGAGGNKQTPSSSTTGGPSNWNFKNPKGYVKIILGIEKDKTKSTLGAVNVELHADMAPHAAHNFLRHCESGYYTGTCFHRLVSNFVLQGGDGENGDGTGGVSAFEDGRPFADEFDARLQFEKRGTLAMANPGIKDQNKSQFFFTLRDDLSEVLFKKHTAFGRVVGNFALLEQISNDVPTEGKNARPKHKIFIEKVEIFSNPFVEFLEWEAKEEEKEAKKKDAVWFNNRRDVMATHANRGKDEVGKYFQIDATKKKSGTSLLMNLPAAGQGNGSNGTSTSSTSLSSKKILNQVASDAAVPGVSTMEELQKSLGQLSKEEREYAAAARKRNQQVKAFTFDDW
ncbi:unnamed protein product [Amoebophrya sp. A25]|nr:unnamed protein product [Amoebophrya sp. A25]|eukprot:GSA25T00018529001.1